MSKPPVHKNQEDALATLSELCLACERIAAAYHSWIWPLSREEAMFQMTARINEMTRVIVIPDNRIPQTCWDVMLAKRAVLQAYISILNPGVEKTALENLLAPLLSPLVAGGPPWGQFIDSLNSLNTPHRAFPFVEGLHTPAEALEGKATVLPERKGFWASLLSLIQIVKGWFQKKPAKEIAETPVLDSNVLSLPPPLEEKRIPNKPSFQREFREPGESYSEKIIPYKNKI
jgi:hypothetical protein